MSGAAAAERLARALEAAGARAMSLAAARGYYGDFTSPLAAPKLQLVADLRELKTAAARDLAARVMAGEFDG